MNPLLSGEYEKALLQMRREGCDVPREIFKDIMTFEDDLWEQWVHYLSVNPGQVTKEQVDRHEYLYALLAAYCGISFDILDQMSTAGVTHNSWNIARHWAEGEMEMLMRVVPERAIAESIVYRAQLL